MLRLHLTCFCGDTTYRTVLQGSPMIDCSERDVDVLFHGTITPERVEILGALRRSALRVVALAGASTDYGEEPAAPFGRSRVFPNLHQYDIHVFEQVRVNYLLINGNAVVSGVLDDTEIPDLYRRMVEPVCGVDAIVDRRRQRAGGESVRRARENAAREGIRAHAQSTLLADMHPRCENPASRQDCRRGRRQTIPSRLCGRCHREKRHASNHANIRFMSRWLRPLRRSEFASSVGNIPRQSRGPQSVSRSKRPWSR